MSLLDRLKLGSVELLIEVGLALWSDVVEPTRNSYQKAVIGKFRTAVSGMAGGRASKFINRLRREVAVFADQFEDGVVRGYHPVRILAHVVRRVSCYRHMATDYKQIIANCT